MRFNEFLEIENHRPKAVEKTSSNSTSSQHHIQTSKKFFGSYIPNKVIYSLIIVLGEAVLHSCQQLFIPESVKCWKDFLHYCCRERTGAMDLIPLPLTPKER